MFIIGLCLHLTFLVSIFDIYFNSPIVQNVISYQPQHKPLADRLVFLIVDGLRAESFVNHTTMPYMRSIANHKGRWGISNTQVPTESRPGHVAAIAGFYEDPSAVFKGWKENPVDFDSVFNESSYTWAWGVREIVGIFAKGHHIHVTGNPQSESFDTNFNTSSLDAWVFETVEKFLQHSVEDRKLFDKLHTDKIILFLHLVATDTAGHMWKPKTNNFTATVKHADDGIKHIEKVIRKFYKDDGKTTFLMTSDHGMTDWGSHGAGDNHETETPYVLWGAGVKNVVDEEIDNSTAGMSLSRRFDVKQADLAPLMSTILSIPVPVNSVGKLHTEILDMSFSEKVKAVYSNSRQLASQYNKKRLDVEKNAIRLFYMPYKPFCDTAYNNKIAKAEILLQNENYEELLKISEEIIDLSLSGLTYYHNYYQTLLLALTSFSFLGWTVYLIQVLCQQKSATLSVTSLINNYKMCSILWVKAINWITGALAMFSCYFIFEQSLPPQYYIYFLMPIFTWWYILTSISIWTWTFRHLSNSTNIHTVAFLLILYSVGLLALGQSFTYKWMLSVPLIGMGVWPLISSIKKDLNGYILFAWMLGCVILSIFAFMPVVGKKSMIQLVITAGLLWLTMSGLYLWRVLLPLYKVGKESRKEITICMIQWFLLAVSIENIYSQSLRYDRGTPVSIVHQSLAWILAVTNLVLPLTSSKRMICRLFSIYTSILNTYLLLSVSHEGLFMIALIFNVSCWVLIEFQSMRLKNIQLKDCTFEKDSEGEPWIIIERSINEQDFRRALIFLFYIFLAFFGTGNIASLNSFEVRWVTCFVTSFYPVVITALVLYKTLLPFIVVACAFRTLQIVTKAPTGCLLIVVLIYSNIMGIQLLYCVKNTGSWLEIGLSISQYVIVQVITLFIVIINQIAKIMTGKEVNVFKLVKSEKKIL